MINVVNDFLDDLRGGRMTDAPIVTVEQGQLQGRLVSSPSAKPYYSFQGIPYAKPPLGSLRFKAPEPAEPWEGIRDATSEGNVSAQTDVLFTNEYVGDENCLFLNVYTPDINATNLPVMIWIHGGGFRFGNGNSSLYGPDYLVEKDVIVVTLNYRCGVLGFLSLNIPEAPGNAGLKDCVQALRWVKENIKSFGGDPSNLTVFGESAGGAAVTLLTASPLSKNLINKAIIESGTALCPWALQKNPVENARKLSQILGNDATDPQEIYEFLSTTPAKELVEAHDKLAPVNEFTENSDNPFCVVIEKEFPGEEAIFTEPFIDILTSGRVADIPVIIGANTLEFTFPPKEDIIALIPQELNIEKNSEQAKDIGDKLKKLYFKDGSDNDVDFYDFISDRLIKVDTYRYVQYLVKVVNKPIYYYNFDYSGELNIGKRLPYGIDVGKALHMDECGYLFKNELVGDVTPSEEDGIMKERMVRLWTNFAKFGNPTPEQDSYLNVTWSPVTQDTLNCLNLSNELTLLANPDKEKMDFWDDLYIKHFRIWEQPKTNTVEIQEPQIPVSNTPEILVSNDTDTAVSNDTETAVSNVPIIIETTEPIIVETSVTTEEDNQGNIIQTFTESVTITSESTTSENTYVETVVESNNIEENRPKIVQEIIEVERPKIVEDIKEIDLPSVKEMVENANNNSGGNYINNHQNGFEKKVRTSNEIKMASSPNGAPKDVIRANDPPEDDLPKNIGVNKFVNFFESLGGKK